jgi:hypothetical protein
MKKFKDFEKSAIDTTTVIGGIGEPVTAPLPAGTVTGIKPPSGDPKDVKTMDWYDEGCC